MTNFTCKDCKDRCLNCHATCEKYLNEKKAFEATKEKAKEESAWLIYQREKAIRIKKLADRKKRAAVYGRRMG